MNSKNALTAALAALACGIAISACGGSSHQATAGTNAQLAISECMRAHDVPNFPDPTRGPGGSQGMTVLITGNSAVTVQGIPFSGPAFEDHLLAVLAAAAGLGDHRDGWLGACEPDR